MNVYFSHGSFASARLTNSVAFTSRGCEQLASVDVNESLIRIPDVVLRSSCEHQNKIEQANKTQ